MTRDPRHPSGFALVIVLWTLALLALLCTELLTATRQDARRVRDQFEAAELEAAADGALRRAIFAMLDTSGGHWPADGVRHTVQIDGVGIVIQIDDEASKVNPNLASVALLRALLTRVGADPVTAADAALSIAEWRDGTNLSDPPNAAAVRYRASGLPYAPLGAPFVHLAELGAVLGMTPELLLRLKPHLTFFTDTEAQPSRHDPIVTQALAAIGEGDGPVANGGSDVVSVTIDAERPNRARLVLRWVVRLNTDARGRRWDILSRERLAGGRR